MQTGWPGDDVLQTASNLDLFYRRRYVVYCSELGCSAGRGCAPSASCFIIHLNVHCTDRHNNQREARSKTARPHDRGHDLDTLHRIKKHATASL